MKNDGLILHLLRWSGKKMLVMRLIVLMVLLPTVMFADPAFSQKQIRMEVQNVSLEQVLKELRVQSGYYILYNKQDVQAIKGISLKVENATVEEILELCLRKTPLQYAIEDQTILISLKKVNVEPEKKLTIRGVVKDTKGEALPGVTVLVKGTTIGVATDVDGKFMMSATRDTVKLLFSFVW